MPQSSRQESRSNKVSEPFKNYISPEVVRTLGNLVKNAYPEFNYKRYSISCLSRLDELELKDRAKLIGENLWRELPDEPETAISTLLDAIEPLPTLETDNTSNGWIFFPINSLLSAHGLEAWGPSMRLIEAVTKRFTAEFGIRVFLIANPERMMPTLRKWANDSDHNVRRLVSEGTRPRLPWGEQIRAFISDPTPILPLLESLRDDPSEYVRRSVANNLNDISKDHPDVVLEIASRWMRKAPTNRIRLVKHACRGLIKQGDPRCLKILGYKKPCLIVTTFEATPERISLGERLTLAFNLESTLQKNQNLIIDFRFYFVKANGRTAPKVFKGSVIKLGSLSNKFLAKTFHLKPITTRKYYTGSSKIELLVNGKPLAETSFYLNVP